MQCLGVENCLKGASYDKTSETACRRLIIRKYPAERKEHPVIVIDFNGIPLSDQEGLTCGIAIKGYDEKYRQSGKKIILIGINFDTEKRNVSEWKIV